MLGVSKRWDLTQESSSVDLKKMHNMSCKLIFIWGKIRTAAQETAPQKALRNFSQETGGKCQYISDFGDGGVYAIKHIFCKRFLLVS